MGRLLHETFNTSVKRFLFSVNWNHSLLVYMCRSLVSKPPKEDGCSGNNRGGLWRAWVRHHTLGQKGVCDFKALSVALQEAKTKQDPLIVSLARIGRAAQMTKKRKGQRSHFGLKSQDKARLQLRESRWGLWKQSVGKQPLQKSRVLSDGVHKTGLQTVLGHCKRVQNAEAGGHGEKSC
eukprot:6492107-Amphidinium_carterae.2